MSLMAKKVSPGSLLRGMDLVNNLLDWIAMTPTTMELITTQADRLDRSALTRGKDAFECFLVRLPVFR